MAKFLGGNWALRVGRMAVWTIWFCVAWLRIEAADVHSDGMRADVLERIKVLRTEIARHDELYFKKAAPEISDEAYDRLKRQLAELERQVITETRNSVPTPERVGDDRSGRFPTWRHRERMLSLAKVYSEAELRMFLKRVAAELAGGKQAAGDFHWVVEPKYDGLAVSVTYERGKLVRVVTRGDGVEGDDVTANARRIATLPETLKGASWPESIEVRGEVLVNFAEFERVNAERTEAGETLFANPRALAAGSLKLDDPDDVAKRGLSVVFYGWGEVRPESGRPVTQSEFHQWIRVWELPGVTGMSCARTVTEVCAQVKAFERKRAELAFPTDGVVIKLDDVAQQRSLGATEHAPRWAVAYKFSAERAETRVKGISVQVGRSGVLTPVANLEPVKLGGSTVTRATLHNAAEITRMDVRVGDTVWVEKAGEIIPAITGVNRARRESAAQAYSFPDDCPVCGAAVVTPLEGGVMQYCPNRACAAQITARLTHFAGANGVAIRGLGEETIAALVEKRGVRSPADLYRLTREDWLKVPGVGAKTAEKLLVAVERSKCAELWRWVHGLGVPGVGVATSRILGVRFGSLDELAAAGKTELVLTSGVSASQADAIAVFFADPEMRAVLVELRACGVNPGRTKAEEKTVGVVWRASGVTDQ